MDIHSPDRIFQRRWALTILERSLELLGAEFVARGKANVGNNTLTLGGANTANNTFSQIIGGTGAGGPTGSLVKTGAGTWVLGGTSANTYTGLTTVSQGILDLNKTAGVNAIAGPASGSKVTENVLINGGTLRLQANEQIGNNVFVRLTSGTFNLNGMTIGTGGLLFSGTANPNLTVSGDHTNQGKLILNSDVTVSSASGTASITSGPALLANGAVDPDQTSVIKGTTSLQNAQRTFTVTNAAAALAVSTVVISTGTSGGLTKAGAGLMTLSAANTYTGPTNVAINGATLAVTGSLSGTSTVTVNTAGTLLLNSAANNIIGTMTPTGPNPTDFTGSTAYSGAGGTLAVDNSQSGRTNTFFSLTLTTASKLNFGTGTANTLLFNTMSPSTFNFLTTGGTLTIDGWTGTPYSIGDTASHVDATQDHFVFTTDPGFGSNFIAGINFTGYDPGAIGVQFDGHYEIVPVPEPATTALIGAIAFCALIGYRQRRRCSCSANK